MQANVQQRRRHSRTQIKVEDLNCRFQLKVQDQCYESIIIRDVSAAGMGLELGEAIAVDQNVMIVLIAGDWQHSIHAKIIWCQRLCDQQDVPIIPRRYQLGMQFNPADTHNNILFFMAARTVVETV